ncbi:hypothetical protein PHK61_25980 [Actinomycetospora lutea]|uniref:hypothetical protein n=1 Tax=Actinomycetospora lutea TaxID=663604 RepID=UPI00236649AA|nr:hypothetical protein [Actinomycetospora lutea]MDD7941871.1 hypothetical protein [Actinomycetospora lutea]
MTTIGCPLDIVRMFYPKYMEDRDTRINSVNIEWINIFNAADVFESNLKSKTDSEQGPASGPSQQRTEPAAVGKTNADEVAAKLSAASIRYLNESLTPLQVLKAKGFRVHSGYWGEADEAHCFEPFVKLLREPTAQAEPRGPVVVDTTEDDVA